MCEENDGHTDRKSSIASIRLFAFSFERGEAPRVEDMLGADLSLEGRADVLGGDPLCGAPFLCKKTAKKTGNRPKSIRLFAVL